MPTDNIRYVQNNYMRPDEIDVRNAARLMTILDKWETGKYQNIWYLLYDVYEAIEEEQIALTISDALSGYNPRFYDHNEDKRAQAIIPSSPYRLVLRAPEIEPCIARNFAGTPYTSRMSGDPFPRIALPARLAKFLRPEDKPTAEQALLSFSLK